VTSQDPGPVTKDLKDGTHAIPWGGSWWPPGGTLESALKLQRAQWNTVHWLEIYVYSMRK
jgi:hypothetical protein